MKGPNLVGVVHLVGVDTGKAIVGREGENRLGHQGRSERRFWVVRMEEGQIGTSVKVSHACELFAVGSGSLLNGQWGRSCSGGESSGRSDGTDLRHGGCIKKLS